MEELDHMVTFARVVKAGSFASGARHLKVTGSVASKHVAKLEQALGVRLLNRNTRKLSLTEAGAAYYAHCARIIEEGHGACARRQHAGSDAARVLGTLSRGPA